MEGTAEEGERSLRVRNENQKDKGEKYQGKKITLQKKITFKLQVFHSNPSGFGDKERPRA